MRRAGLMALACALLCYPAASAFAAYVLFEDDFEMSWSGDYAPGWVNTDYRHGEPPVGQMMQQTSQAHSGSYGLLLTAAFTPETWMWWAGVEIESLPHWALATEYDPYFSAWYYDEGADGDFAGQIYAVPDWVNPYIDGSEDWTDVQFGARDNVEDYYYYVAAGESSPGWVATSAPREAGWHQLTMQLSSADGRIHFFLDGTEVGASYRDDYINLGEAMGLYTRFAAPLSQWNPNPTTIWDDVEVGSAVPEPVSMVMLGCLGAGMFGAARLKRRKL